MNERSIYPKAIKIKEMVFRLGKVFGYGTQLEFSIPRDHQSEFTPTILALYRDQEKYLNEVSF